MIKRAHVPRYDAANGLIAHKIVERFWCFISVLLIAGARCACLIQTGKLQGFSLYLVVTEGVGAADGQFEL